MSIDVTKDRDTLSTRVAEEIRVAMVRRRMSGRALATALDVSPAWVSYRLTGSQAIDLDDLERMAGALKISPIDLVRAAIERLGHTTSPYATAGGHVPQPRSPMLAGHDPDIKPPHWGTVSIAMPSAMRSPPRTPGRTAPTGR